METEKIRLLYEDVLEQIKNSKYLDEREKERTTNEINEMLKDGKIKMVPSSLSSERGKLGVIFVWAQSPSGWSYWNKINSLI